MNNNITTEHLGMGLLTPPAATLDARFPFQHPKVITDDGRIIPSETDRAIAAGFFAGEGWVGLNLDKKRGRQGNWTLRVRIAQVEQQSLLWFKERWGGCVIANPRRGKLLAAHSFWVWDVKCRLAERFLSAIHPYLQQFTQNKSEQVRLGIESRKYVGWHSGARMPDAIFGKLVEIDKQLRLVKRQL